MIKIRLVIYCPIYNDYTVKQFFILLVLHDRHSKIMSTPEIFSTHIWQG